MSVDFTTTREARANFSNLNARSVLAMIGLGDADLWGQVEVADLPALAQRIIRALNLVSARAPFTSEYVETHNPGECRVIACEVTDESHQRRLRELLAVVHAGIAADKPLTWA